MASYRQQIATFPYAAQRKWAFGLIVDKKGENACGRVCLLSA